MEFVNSRDDIMLNISTLRQYLQGDASSENYAYAIGKIKEGICFVAIKTEDTYEFFPSRFVGYKNNSADSHERNDERDGRDTNSVITDILGTRLFDERSDEWENLESEYEAYCHKLGFTARIRVPFRPKGKKGSGRKYWRMSR